jgi:excisionase family DNA binding protein
MMATFATTRREVLTLEEAARHLRLPEKEIEELAARGIIPGRRVKDDWRFLRAALDDWLRTPDYRTTLLEQAGALAHDESLPQLRKSIYKRRGRPEVKGIQS